MTREEKQQELIKIGVENKRCTLVASTGLGKTYIALEIIKQLKPKTVLWVGPSANLEENVKKEIVKWNFNEEVDLQIKTIQLAYKFENQYYDLLIGDESHTIVTEEYSKLLLNNNFNNIIFLTATPEDYKEEKRLLYEKYAPIKVRYSSSEEDGFTNKIQIYHFTYDLTDNFKFKIEYRKGKEVKSFNKGELTHYAYLCDQYEKGRIKMLQLEKEYFTNLLNSAETEEERSAIIFSKKNIYDLSFIWMNNAPTPEHKKAAILYNNAIKKRKKFLLNLESLTYYAKIIGNKIISKGEKVVIFCEELDHARTITKNIYEGSDNEKKILLDKFNSGEIKGIGSSKGLSIGLNIVDLRYVIFASYIGSSTSAEQKKGRANRLGKDEVAKLIILHPKNTQYDTWYAKMISEMSISLDIIEVDNVNHLINII